MQVIEPVVYDIITGFYDYKEAWKNKIPLDDEICIRFAKNRHLFLNGGPVTLKTQFIYKCIGCPEFAFKTGIYTSKEKAYAFKSAYPIDMIKLI